MNQSRICRTIRSAMPAPRTIPHAITIRNNYVIVQRCADHDRDSDRTPCRDPNDEPEWQANEPQQLIRSIIEHPEHEPDFPKRLTTEQCLHSVPNVVEPTNSQAQSASSSAAFRESAKIIVERFLGQDSQQSSQSLASACPNLVHQSQQRLREHVATALSLKLPK